MHGARPFGFIVAALIGWPAVAQQTAGPELPIPAPQAVPSATILTLDQEALYRESRWGRRAQADLEARSRALSAENDRIAAQLEAEDDALTALKATLPEDEFRRRADAFDAKVQGVRQDRDQAGQALLASAETDRTDFLNAALPVLSALMRERGAVALLDRRTVFLSIEQIDVTRALIARIDTVIGEGPAEKGGPASGDAAAGGAAIVGGPVAGAPPAETTFESKGSLDSGTTARPANGAAPPKPDEAQTGRASDGGRATDGAPAGIVPDAAASPGAPAAATAPAATRGPAAAGAEGAAPTPAGSDAPIGDDLPSGMAGVPPPLGAAPRVQR